MDGKINFRSGESGTYSFFQNDGQQATIDLTEIPLSIEIKGPWEIHFSGNWDVPDSIILRDLSSWTDHPDIGIRHFSGTARYLKKIIIPGNLIKPGLHLILDLGDVRMMAELIVNGNNLGVLWKKPFQADITHAIRTGENDLEIRITNTWWNRLVGDEKFPQGFPGSGTKHPRTFTTHKAWNAESQLMPSGLLGPVRIGLEKVVNISEQR